MGSYMRSVSPILRFQSTLVRKALMRRFTHVATMAAMVTAVSTLGSAPQQALASAGGLSVSPAIVEHTAQRGIVGAITVANTTSTAFKVSVSVRPWIQSSTGAVAPNPRRTLSGVRPSKSSLTLAAGARQVVSLSLLGVPTGGSLYGSIQVVGTPRKATARNGVSVAYRLIGTLRLDAARKLLKLQTANIGIVGRGRGARSH